MKLKFKEYLNLIKEMIGFIKERKAYWLAPIIFVLLMIGSLFFFLEGSIVAPFIYAIF